MWISRLLRVLRIRFLPNSVSWKVLWNVAHHVSAWNKTLHVLLKFLLKMYYHCSTLELNVDITLVNKNN